jgi:hypothetical protein
MPFKFAQGNTGEIQYAHISVPGCGRNEKDDAPTILVEIALDGTISLAVYADIQSTEATHEIVLNGALLEKKAPKKEKDDAN